MNERLQRVEGLLAELYGARRGADLLPEVKDLLERYRGRIPAPRSTGLSQRDAILITYADQVQQPGQPPLATLADFSRAYLKGVVSGLHILPFYPSTSDDGFSVSDYTRVDPALGGWEHIRQLGGDFRLMFDAVFNHASAQGEWFQAYLRNDPAYRDFFIAVDDQPDLSQVVRPRALPLLTVFTAADGPRQIWTTFSTDQVDLNYVNPRVLLSMLDVLLFYVGKGAELIRLDAIAYLWKQIGTPCIHLPQTHAVVQLMRAVLDGVAPHVMLVTETNVPHADNISYFGDGANEAQMVYNFPQPPLVLHTLRSGNASALSAWAAGLKPPSPGTTFFNFLASHDGIGLNPLRGILPPAQIEALVQAALAHGGRVSYKHNPDGSQSPYELNINYFDALSDPAGGEEEGKQVRRFVAAHAILLALQGVPGIYFHSLFGSRGWPEGITKTGQNRSINRQKLVLDELEADLANPSGRRRMVYDWLATMLRLRAAEPAFDPQVGQEVLDAGPGLFALRRGDLTCLVNVTGRAVEIPAALRRGVDLLGSRKPEVLEAYGIRWLKK
ncbi:glycosidase [Longilinea arvoryzae]|uniref:Glycosidase n=1 Tax=Longilinea arvoryzae TaxID=360412 RepID=A0A0S7BMF1_9CHLR|nr:sugar phosphorylase [Longilinea arvoryzae]GAP15875.1 glycosidase [Longilinea arvoryzae]